jgi:hypothetical protein
MEQLKQKGRQVIKLSRGNTCKETNKKKKTAKEVIKPAVIKTKNRSNCEIGNHNRNII